MKGKITRLISCLLAMLLMCGDAVAATEVVINTLALPAELQIIEAEAFCGDSSIDRLVVPDGTKEIHSRAFADSSLTEVVLPDSLTFIADDAFEGCGQINVTVPENCYAYDWAVRLGYIRIGVSTPAECFTTTLLSDGTLSIQKYTGSYTDVVIPSEINGIQVTTVGDSAFRDCNELTSVVIPEGVISIEESAFRYCSELASVSFPSTLEKIGEYAFGYCYALTSADFSETQLKSLGKALFTFCESLVEVKLPKTLETIDNLAFHACDGLISLDLSETAVVSIGASAFWACNGLQTVVLPETVKSIASFGHCTNLTSINLEETSLEVIGYNAFVGCSQLKNVVLPETVKCIEAEAFSKCTGLESISFPVTLESIEDSAFNGCSMFKVTVPEDCYAYDWAVRMGYIKEPTLNAPENVSVSVIGDRALEIAWSAVTDAEGYYVICDETVVAEVAGGDNCSYKWENLDADTVYTVSVKAYAHKENGNEIPCLESEKVTCRTAGILTVEATITANKLMLSEAITINAMVSGYYGEYTYRYTILKGSEMVAQSGVCNQAQYNYTPVSVGTYTAIVVVTDSLGRSAGCQIDDITVDATALEVAEVSIDKPIIMLGETITIAAVSNREDGLTYSANVYCGDIKVDSIIGIEQLVYTPDAEGVYSFAVEVTDAYGGKAYEYLKNCLTVIPYWKLEQVSANVEKATVGQEISFTITLLGDTDNVELTYTVYRDEEIYRQVTDVTQQKYAFSANDEGLYTCVCVAVDQYNNEMAVTSVPVEVTREITGNEDYNWPTYGTVLNVDQLDGKDEEDTCLTGHTEIRCPHILLTSRSRLLGRRTPL